MADFDGSGSVRWADMRLLLRQMATHEYIAFYDRNADGRLDLVDVFSTALDHRRSSTTLDQQLTTLFWSTEIYRDQSEAIAAGYRPFTQILAGHGMHFSKLPFLVTATGLDPTYQNILDGTLDIGEPEGLNYDENGKLTAVFYYHGINIRDWVFATGDAQAALFQQSVVMTSMSAGSGGMHPMLYDSHEAMWHHHWGGCWDGLDYAAMAFDSTIIPHFTQPLYPQECAARATSPTDRQGWVPGFNMLHVWLYDLNPCGLFAGTHPHTAEGYPHEPQVRPLDEWFTNMGIPNPGGMGH